MSAFDLSRSLDGGLWSSLDHTARAKLLGFSADLLRFNRSQNLVSRVDPEREISLLLEECIRAARALAGAALGPWLDVGAGGGIPGIPLACLLPHRTVDLVERRQGRCDFMRREVASLGLRNARVIQGDVESLYGVDRYSLVTAKAVAEPGLIEGLCDPVVADGGSLVLFQRAGWLKLGDQSPGGWVIAETWAGTIGPQGSVVREGFRLERT